MSTAVPLSSEKPRCSKSRTGHYGTSIHCRLGASVVRDGKPYCMVHDPVRLAERQALRDAKRDRAEERSRAKWHRSDVERELLDAVEKASAWSVQEQREREMVLACEKALASLRGGPA